MQTYSNAGGRGGPRQDGELMPDKRERKAAHKRAIRRRAMRDAIDKGVREGWITRTWNPIIGDYELTRGPKPRIPRAD